MHTMGLQTRIAKAATLEDLLETRVRQHHNQPDFKQQQWVAYLRGLSPPAVQSIEKARLGICFQKVHEAYMWDVKQNAPEDIDDVMKGHDPLKKAAYVRSKVEDHYQHILTIPFERSTTATQVGRTS